MQLDGYLACDPPPGNFVETNSPFFIRTCVIIPINHRGDKDRAARELRRQELNELRIRITFGSMGIPLELASSVTDDMNTMIKQWQIGMIDLDTLSQVVDRVLASSRIEPVDSLKPRIIPWIALQSSWVACTEYQDETLSWIHSQISSKKYIGTSADPIIQRVKQMPLDDDERNLLHCLLNPDQITTTFDQVHQTVEIIDRIRTLVSLPHLFPEHFQTGILKSHSLGGALLFGPPGTGKTLVAQAVAKESGVRMLVFKPTDIVDKCDGQSEKIVASLFKLARRLKPCLIFMDEIDGLLGTRIYHQGNNSGHWDTKILTQFMQEMDGLISSDVLVIGTTNRPFDLDEAIVRRLPHRIMIDLPKRRARREIMRILLRDEVLAPDVNLRDIARETKRFSGSDLRGLCVSAALAAAKENLILPWMTSADSCQPKSTAESCQATQGSENYHIQMAFVDRSNNIESTETSLAAGSEQPTTLPPMYGSTRAGNGAGSPATSNTNYSTANKFDRVISDRHFRTALRENRATACESSKAHQELREWGKKYGGHAAQERNPKSLVDYSRYAPL